MGKSNLEIHNLIQLLAQVI